MRRIVTAIFFKINIINSPVFRAQIIGIGILLRDAEPLKRQQLFMRSLKEYAMLNEERWEILQTLLQEDES
ncbi:hypothetical protein VK70_02700 [Paenibacillus durus ATCC 35681]|uniref:Uncharacterized protein n=1 Tax=Paenibacillus durus ATCC 35681 TaxID=1333534 RepID=A0A0F7F733_PAEDU|nr:hypothetical protein VK70_02700 [Paenibacillus durus ATCC 35681]